MREEQRDTFGGRAVQSHPHEGAWAGGWPRPGQKTWLAIEHEKRTARPPESSAPEADRTDRRLEQDVQAALDDLDLDTGAVEVTAGGGRVLLGGRVASPADRLSVLRAAGAVPGVAGVYDQIVVPSGDRA